MSWFHGLMNKYLPLTIDEDQAFIFFEWILQVPIAFLMITKMSPAKSKILNFIGGFLFNFIYLSHGQFAMLLLFCFISYFIVTLLKHSFLSNKRLSPSNVLKIAFIFSFVSFTISYLYIAGFDFNSYIYQMPTSYMFIVQRILHYTFYYSQNETLLGEVDLWSYFSYIFGIIGLAAGPYFDYENYKNIFGASTFKSNKSTIKCYAKRFVIALVLLIVFQNISYMAKTNNTLSFFNDYIFSLVVLWKKTFVLTVSLYSLLAQVILGYDLNLFLTPENKDTEKYSAYSIKTLGFSGSFRNDVSIWNLAFVRWLNLIIRSLVPKDIAAIAILMASAALHGPSIGYWLTALMTIFCLLINKMWFKLRTQKKSLRFINNYVHTLPYQIVSHALNAYFSSIAAIPFFYIKLKDIHLYFSKTYYIPVAIIFIAKLVIDLLYKIMLY